MPGILEGSLISWVALLENMSSSPPLLCLLRKKELMTYEAWKYTYEKLTTIGIVSVAILKRRLLRTVGA